MLHIKSKEGLSVAFALLCSFCVIVVMIYAQIDWLVIFCIAFATFTTMGLISYLMLRNYIAHKLQPIYSIVLSRDIKPDEIIEQLKTGKRVEYISTELSEWASVNDQLIAQLKQTEIFRKQYLGNVAHELRTPIFNIQGYISTLLDGGLEDENINRKYLERAERSAERMSNIVKDLDTISRLESNMTTLNIEQFDVVALAREVAEQEEMVAERRGITIKVRGGKDLPSLYWAEADKHYIGQVLINLISNAIRYGRDGGNIQVNVLDMIDTILVEVTDNGLGIAKEDQARIFERFYRIDKGRSRNDGGTGLGLAIVKHIIEAHNQRVNVRSELGAGTTFSFTLKKVNIKNIK